MTERKSKARQTVAAPTDFDRLIEQYGNKHWRSAERELRRRVDGFPALLAALVRLMAAVGYVNAEGDFPGEMAQARAAVSAAEGGAES